MRRRVRRLLAALSNRRYVGKFVKIAAAVWRSPASVERIANLQGRVDYLENLHREQLGRLFDIVTDIHHQQLTNDSETANLVRSAPVILRRLQRAQHALDGLPAQVDLLLQLPAEVDLISQRSAELAEGFVRLQDTVAAEHASDGGISERVAAVDARTEDHAQTLTYLLERLEFVRAELMFEVRYGAGSEAPAVREPVVKHLVQGQDSLRVNLGSGHVPIEGYTNVDNRDLPGVDVVADIEALPFDAGSVTEFYSAHFLEHFPEERLRRRILPYLLSLMAPGGEFRAVVPDAGAMMSQFAVGEFAFDDLRLVMYGGQDYDGDFHFTMFTEKSLTELLESVGLKDVQVVEGGRRNGKALELEVRSVKASV